MKSICIFDYACQSESYSTRPLFKENWQMLEQEVILKVKLGVQSKRVSTVLSTMCLTKFTFASIYSMLKDLTSRMAHYVSSLGLFVDIIAALKPNPLKRVIYSCKVAYKIKFCKSVIQSCHVGKLARIEYNVRFPSFQYA